MSFYATITGTYPPLKPPSEPLTEQQTIDSVRNALRDQIGANVDKDINWIFVDGQPQSDIVGIFARGLGLIGDGLPYRIKDRIKPRERSVTSFTLKAAASFLREQGLVGAQLKAHITGPTLMAESCFLNTEETPERYQDTSEGFRQLTLDFAEALAQEVRLLQQETELPLVFIQIDEPTLAYGADLTLARDAVGIITKVATVPTILHVCGNVRDILEQLLTFPVNILNVEGRHIRMLPWLNRNRLQESGKKLALGCFPVNTRAVPHIHSLERELLFDKDRYGPEHIWGITPDCGLRMSDFETAKSYLKCLTEVAQRITPSFERESQ